MATTLQCIFDESIVVINKTVQNIEFSFYFLMALINAQFFKD